MTTNISSTKADVQAEYQALLTGLDVNAPEQTSYDLLGQTYTRAAYFKLMQARIDAAETTKAAKIQWHAAVAAERAAEAAARPLRGAMKSVLEGRYGKTSPKLQEFGFAQASTRKVSAAVQARAVLRAASTRELLHTMGKNHKKDAIEAAAAQAPAPVAAVTESRQDGGGSGRGPPSPAR